MNALLFFAFFCFVGYVVDRLIAQSFGVSLFTKICRKFCSHLVVGAIGCASRLLLEPRIPIVKLVQTITEAKSFLDCKEHEIGLGSALSEASLVERLGDDGVFLGQARKVVLHAQLFRFSFSFLDRKVSQTLVTVGD